MSSFYLRSTLNGAERIINELSVQASYDGHMTLSGVIPELPKTGTYSRGIGNLLGATVAIEINKNSGDESDDEQAPAVSMEKSQPSSTRLTAFIDQLTISRDGIGQQLTLTAYSPTVFLDCAPGFQAFNNKTLYDIAETLLRDGHCPYRIASNARNHSFDWVVQCQESAYNLLKRLCSQTGVFECFFDGEQLVIDDLTNPETYELVLLKEGDNMSDLSISFDTYPQAFTVEARDYVGDQTLHSRPQPIQSQSRLIKLILDASKAYPEQRIFSPFSMANQESINNISHRMAAAQANNLIVVHGSTIEASIKVGTQLEIASSLLNDELQGQRFTVLGVSHNYQEPGMYSNTFTAIPSSLPFNLPMSYDKPSMGPLSAVVEKIKGDPKKLGRVCVSLVGDPNKSLSPWLRLLQPGGWYAPPKVGDHVIILGEQFNPECSPVVLGSFYTGNRDASFWEGKDGGIKHEKFECYLQDGKVKMQAGQFEMILNQVFKLTSSMIKFFKK